MPFSIEYIKKPKNWIWIILVFDMFYKALINYLKLPESINYFNDVACLVLLHSCIMTFRKKKMIGAALLQVKIILILLVETIFGYLLNIYRPLTYLWGIRILFRFMVFFIACTMYVDYSILKSFDSLIFYAVILNVLLTTLQYLNGYSLDAVTGFFSLGKNSIGGSAGLNTFMCITCTYYYVSAMNKHTSIYKFLVSLFSCVYMAAIGELKMFYFELVIILLFGSLFSKISLKRLLGTIVGISVSMFGMKIYDFYYGTKNSLDFVSMLEYAGASGSTYGKEYSLNRLTAIPYVWNNLLDDIPKKLFGLGIGYTDNISSSLFSSGFLEKNGSLGFHLWGISLELANLGIIGLTIYIIFFGSVFFYACLAQKSDSNNENYYITCKIIVLIAFISLFYNTALILDLSAPFLFFVMSIPFALKNRKFKR